ncbi:hypothetical protein V8F33_013854 [Rhypophila sp. PSN 637]
MSTPSSSRAGTGFGTPSEPEFKTHLRLIKTVNATFPRVNIVLVPGIGALPSDSWGVCSGSWTRFFTGLSATIMVYSYDHGLLPNQLSGWEIILENGHHLIAALEKLLQEESDESNLAPIIFICHGFGGAILKQALCIANRNYERYSVLIKTIGGIVFLGTPHRLEGVSEQQLGERLSHILKFDSGNSSNMTNKMLNKLKLEVKYMVDLASRFNKANYRVDVLSVYEKRPSNMKATRVGIPKTKRIILVDEDLCTIFPQSEQLLGVNLDHAGLPTMIGDDGEAIEEIRVWMESMIVASLKNVADRLVEMQPSSRSSSSVSLEEVKRSLENQINREQSNETSTARAKMGSIPDVASLLENFSMKQVDPRIPCFMVDTFVRNKDFYGRQDVLTRLDACLLPSKDLLVSSQPDRIRVALLCGMGGLGKTETAIEYVYSRRVEFDAIFWVRAEDSSKLEEDIAKIAVRLGINDATAPNERAINKSIAIEWLCNPTKMEHFEDDPGPVPASWLIVFDNADDPEILAPYQDIAERGSVIITSRSPLAKTSLSSATTAIDIQPFDNNDAGHFVEKLTKGDCPFEEAKMIGERLGGLPLALAQMAGVIRLHHLSSAEFLDTYNDIEEQADLHKKNSQPLRKTARGTISTIWALEKLTPKAACLLDLLAFLDPDCIQESLLSPIQNPSIAEITLENYPKKKVPFFDARKQLIDSSLVRYNKEKSAAEFWIHRVTQDVARTRIGVDQIRHVFDNAVAIVLRAWPAPAVGGHAVDLWAESEALYPHVTSLRNAFLTYFSEGNPPENRHFAELLVKASWYQHERGESWKVKPFLELALDICTRANSADLRDLMSDIRYVLGAVANETNDAESCLEHTRIFLEIRLEIAAETGEVDERLARAHNERGIAWMMSGDYKKGEEAFSTAAATYEKLPNYTKDKRSLALVNLGLALWLQGNLSEASKILEMGLADRVELYGEMDSHSFRTGRFLHALGNVRHSQNQTTESEDFHRRALMQYQSTIRNWHHRTADVCHKVAQHCLHAGEHDNALALIEQALKAWSVDAEKYVPEIARTTFLKATVLSAVRRDKEEVDGLREQAVSLRRKVVGSISPRLRGVAGSHFAASAASEDEKALTEENFDCLVTFWSR